MCVIYYCPDESKRPPLDELEAGEDRNRDGGGLAYFTLEELTPAATKKGLPARKIPTWEKGLKAKEIHEKLQNIPGPVLVHFRTASIGDPIAALTHPFPMDPLASVALKGKSEGGLMMQNGTWSGWKFSLKEAIRHGAGRIQLPDRGPWSDTRALAWLSGIYGPTWLDLEDHASLLAVMLPSDPAKGIGGRMYAIGENWLTRDGWKQSCLTTRSSSYRGGNQTHSGGRFPWAEAEEEERTKKQKERDEKMSHIYVPDHIKAVKNLPKILEATKMKLADPVAHYTDYELATALEHLEANEVPLAGVES